MDERGDRLRAEEQRQLTDGPASAEDNGKDVPTPVEPAKQTAPQEIGTPFRQLAAAEEVGRRPTAAEGSPEGMSNLMADMGASYRSPQRGDVVDGTVVRIDKDGVMVDIGTKSEGIIPSNELSGLSPREEQLKVGDKVLVYVLQTEDQEGHVVLSLRRARSERGWRTAQKQFEDGQTIEAEVIDYNRGGLIVNIDGLRGFVPISQVVGLRHDAMSESDTQGKMAAMVGRQMALKILELNRRRNRLILSERSAVQERRSQRKEQLLSELAEGQVRHGHVSSLCDFGAFIDLGGADGLVHLSELSWGQVAHPSEIVKVGDEVDVYVLGVDREKKKIALSLRRGQAEPWSKIADKYRVGDLVTGKVTKLAQFGAFARIEDGIEGLIHVSELGEGRIQHPKNVVREGEVLTLRIIRIDPARRRLGLSLKQVEQQEIQSPSEVSEVHGADEQPSQVASADVATQSDAQEMISGMEPEPLAEAPQEQREETADSVVVPVSEETPAGQ